MTDVYERLRQKLDGMTKGYPKTEKGSEFAFLKKTFNESDAEFFIKFKPGLQSPQQVADHMGISLEDAQEQLEAMSKKGLLYWERDGHEKKYRIIPFIHGLWEFRVDKFDRQDAANMRQFYVDGFGKTLLDYRLPIARIVPVRPDTVREGKLLPYDDIEATIKRQTLIVANDCACRKVALFAKKSCGCTENINVCIAFGRMAEFMLESQIGNPHVLTVEQTVEILHKDDSAGLFVQMAHSKECSGFCNCAKCHCGILIGAKIEQGTGFESWSNYKCTKDETVCINCGKCVERCPMKAMTFNQDDKAVFNKARCFGCGLCVTTCPSGALILERKPDDRLTVPQDDTFFDNQERMGLEKAEVDKTRRAQAT
ncbi:MAG: ATP-binding protein [Dehalococcoidia bacterium]